MLPQLAFSRVPASVRSLAAVLAAGWVSQSCISNHRLVYLQDPSIRTKQAALFENQHPIYRLQQGDVLNVSVKGANAEIAALFNSNNGGALGNYNDPTSQYINGFSIDASGEILMPVVGRTVVKGLSVPEAEKLIQQKINNYLREATVIVKMVSFKITILGEVKKPGYYFVTNNQCNILEAIGIGGDLTNVGNRQRIKLIRQNGIGTEVILLDLTDANLIRSPYYYIQPNDVIFVEPLPGQTAKLNFTPTAAVIGIITSVIGTSITTILLINNNNNK